ncbi:MAG: 2-hydroxyacid dehydrogenase [Alphaproteobacteria bacterium]|nr:2-hydroxyacid dehydrogenase [Alphaproteobacteria bacterium]
MKPELLLVSPLPPRVTEALKDNFVLHDYYRAKDKPGMLKEVGGKVRGYISFASAGGADAALMDATPKVELIANWGVGYDRVDAAAAKQRDIVVTNTPDVLTDCCADLAMALILAVARRVAEGDRYVRAGNWPKLGNLALATRVNGSRLGIVGLGRIGKAAAKRAEAFDMTIAYYGRRKQKDAPYDYYDDAVKLAKNSDFLLLTCPGGPETHHLVNSEVLNAIGPEGFLINIARGSVVDEEALVAALKEKRIAGAALDVFAKEPQVPAALMTMDNVVLQPHQSSATSATRRAMDDLVVENLRLHFAGKPVRTPV